MKRLIKKAWALLLTLALLAGFSLPAFAGQEELKRICDEATSDVTAAILYDKTNGVVLYEKNADRHVSIGSITKVLNACAAVKYMNEDFEITVAGEIDYVKAYASRAPLSKGERYTFGQLLHAMLIPSGCDAAYVIADMVGRLAAGGRDSGLGTWDALQGGVAEMNKVLQELGCRDSRFVNPDGQDAEGQYTTCRDYMKVLCHAMDDPLIRSVVSKYHYECYDVTGNYHSWDTTNSMINPNSDFYYSGAKGIKTGSADAAGYCLALEAERGGRTLVSLVVGAESGSHRCRVTTKMMDAGFDCPVSNTGTSTGNPNPTPGGNTAPGVGGQTGVRPMGDVDGDKQVTPSDARLTLRISIWLEDPAKFDIAYADMDGDRYITPADARKVLRLAVGLDAA